MIRALALVVLLSGCASPVAALKAKCGVYERTTDFAVDDRLFQCGLEVEVTIVRTK